MEHKNEKVRPNARVFPSLRTVINHEALAWLSQNPAPPGTGVVTSLPDVSEMSGMDFTVWRSWFVDTVDKIIRWLPPDGVAIFYQTDIRRGGAWIDKSFLVQLGMEQAKAHLLFHKIVCRKPPGTISAGRPTYAHMLAIAKIPRPNPSRPGPEVLAFGGEMNWARAMGVEACRVACRFLRDETRTTLIVDPFCGRGGLLAVANDFGFSSLGVDLSAKRCRIAIETTTTNILRKGRKSAETQAPRGS